MRARLLWFLAGSVAVILAASVYALWWSNTSLSAITISTTDKTPVLSTHNPLHLSKQVKDLISTYNDDDNMETERIQACSTIDPAHPGNVDDFAPGSLFSIQQCLNWISADHSGMTITKTVKGMQITITDPTYATTPPECRSRYLPTAATCAHPSWK